MPSKKNSKSASKNSVTVDLKQTVDPSTLRDGKWPPLKMSPFPNETFEEASERLGYTVCWAMGKRRGTPCKAPAMANGRCYVHGGKNPGPPKKNKNSVTTGERETIWMDTLTAREQQLYHQVQTDVLVQIDEEIRLITLRERRMLARIALLKVDEFSVTEYEDKVGMDKGYDTELKTKRYVSNATQVHNIEEALTRVQDRKARLLDLKHKVSTASGPSDMPNVDRFLQALGATATEVWSES